MGHIPERMCVACRTMRAQNELIRIVNENGTAVLDMGKKRFGRGAYICKNPDCIRKTRKKKMVERHLGCSIPEALYEECMSLIEQGLPEMKKG